jgi:uncharacterized protein
MKNLTATLCLTLTILLGSIGVSASADFQRGMTAYKSGDYATAVREWTLLAKQGDAESQRYLGTMYAIGKGVSQDYKTAVKWYKLAAEQGNASAQNNLSLSYVMGTGVIQDNVYAHMWGNLAASNGSEGGGDMRDIVAKEMTPSQLETAQKLARECVRKNYKGC